MRALLAVLVVVLLGAGCFGKDAPVVTKADANDSNASRPADFALPVGGSSAAKDETNKTVNGTFGAKHVHDYWKGHDSMVIFQRDVVPEIFPIFPGGQGSQPQGVTYVIIPNGTLVWEGTEKVTVVAKPPTVRGTAEPAPPAVSFQFRTAADTKWRPAQQLAYGAPVEIKVKPDETDMPHSTQSLWNFRLVFERASFNEAVNITITVYRGRDVVDWPGHPDFYADGKTERVIVDKDVVTHQDGFPKDGFYEGTEAWFAPDKLVSWQTGLLDVFVNVTGFSSTPPIPATHYELYYHNATRLGIGCCDGDLAQDVDGKDDLKSYHFQVNVTTDGMDGPYQPSSRWGFHVAAVTGAFSDSTSYDITYHIKIVARRAADASAQVPVT